MTASTVGHASYRYKTMLKANIFVQLFTLPENIQLRVNAIFSREVSVSKTSQMDGIVKRMAGDMMKRMQGQTMEAHYLTIIFKGLEAMDSEGEFCLCPQYKCDPTLQPRGRGMRVSFNLGNVDQVSDELRDNPQRSRKRQRTDSLSDAVLEETQGSESVKPSSVKVPCSDFTMGLSTDTLAGALSTKYGVPVWQAQAFLQQLESMEGFRPHPYKNPVGYWFPTLVIEAKAFSTGRSLFEAENQAAVSACYMLNALQRFADSYDGAVQQAIPPPTPIGKDTPLVFSITVYGPLLQLWVHYALKHNNSTSYHMNILKSCHACVTSELQAFLAMVDQIMSWNKAEVLPEMMNQVVQLSNILDFEAIVLEG
ncbi:hypothetical protein PV08_07275 [Exophiala spinifera]|uniref:DUF7924 domain-containing protein n=1 Tax=Exophiala spinifera TaxID=91928 RepID=A0A0D1YHW3_9EURO|nr:uncharacterized protein PV08_07275 [Exophiala spinifera]KIW14491.1 hypothetical protein PV08_07275 [Exophiala spinifera]